MFGKKLEDGLQIKARSDLGQDSRSGSRSDYATIQLVSFWFHRTSTCWKKSHTLSSAELKKIIQDADVVILNMGKQHWTVDVVRLKPSLTDEYEHGFAVP